MPSLAAAPGPVQSYDTYNAWYVACDNTLRCVARGMSDEAQVTITRDAGPDGPIKVEIDASYAFPLAALRSDGRPVTIDGHAWQSVTEEESTSAATHDLAAVRSLVQQLRKAGQLSLGDHDPVPLGGLTAALLRIDERQGRLGGVTGLVRSGPLPATRVPPAPPVPRIAAQPILATLAQGEDRRLIAAVRIRQEATIAGADCELRHEVMTPEAHALDRQRALVLIPCLQGAYQGSSLAFIAGRIDGSTRQLILKTPVAGNQPDPSRGSIDEFTEADFDPKTGTLGMGAKGRGIGDCGTTIEWTWTGTAFVLSSMTRQDACGGGQGGDWPVLFRSTR
jgi:hypothetical protein